uniref:MATH domain-containing protein n=1 Tax=Leersia perrieri TaxID=77586 RepID=A0A0D9WT26_9ORYZ
MACNLTEAATVRQIFKVNGYSATKASADPFPSKRLTVGGYEWEIHYNPKLYEIGTY